MGKEIKPRQGFDPIREPVKKETIDKIIGECRRLFEIVAISESKAPLRNVSANSGRFVANISKFNFYGYKYPGEGYDICIFRSCKDEKEKVEQELLPDPLRYNYFLGKNGCLIASWFFPYWVRDSLQSKSEMEIEILNEKIKWFQSQGKEIETKSEKDYWGAESVLKGERSPAIVPNESHANKILWILKKMNSAEKFETPGL